MICFYILLTDGAKKSTNDVTNKPLAQIINNPNELVYVIAIPPNNIESGIRPWEPILITLLTLPSLSFSTIFIIAVEDGTLIQMIAAPISKRITNKIINKALIFIILLVNNA